jgi:hypothetical protein
VAHRPAKPGKGLSVVNEVESLKPEHPGEGAGGHGAAEDRQEKKPKHEIDVGIEYNGLRKEVEISRDATVKELLDRAIAAFGNLPQPHTLALWDQHGAELTNEQQSLKDAKIKDGDVLLLRPSAVKGG